MESPEAQLEILKRGAAQIISEAELLAKLKKGKPLNVKLGVDPTAPDIHLGFTVCLQKLRQFQDLGHQAILIIGDFTAQIGDPSGRSKTRPQLTHDQVMQNAKSFQAQAFKILDPAKTRTVFNGEWFEIMTFDEVMKLNARVTLQQMLQREDFRSRVDRGDAVRLHEIQYPIMQGWDSVKVKADVELGGTDQLFNILVGRDLQREEGQPEQVVFLMPLLEGLDGVQKMSKSLGNYIGINESPQEMFGKVMSISDELMWRYYELCTDLSPTDVASLQENTNGGQRNPRDVKAELAKRIVADFYTEAEAYKAEEEFNSMFRNKQAPDVVEERTLEAGQWKLPRLLVELDLAPSMAEARRLIEQGGVYVEGERRTQTDFEVTLSPDQSHLIQVGKRRFVRVKAQK